MDQLLSDLARSPYQAKIIEDYNWIEVELALQLNCVRQRGRLSLAGASHRTTSALDFGLAAVTLHQRLSERGRQILLGRLRDGLNKGFAALYLEIDMAQQLVEGGYEVRYPDFDGSGRHDLDAVRNNLAIAIECKSISADAGRKVHRRDFYRFMDLVDLRDKEPGPVTSSAAVVVRVADRFPADRRVQDLIVEDVRELFSAEPGTRRAGDCYTAHTERFIGLDLGTASSNLSAAALRGRWGENSHIAGVSINGRWNLVVVRSRREDDPSRAALAARKEASRQLPTDRPGMVALQYEEITVQDLTKPSFRRRLKILDAAIYADDRAAHVAGMYHCAFDGRWAHAGREGKPAVTSWRSHQHAALMPKSLGQDINDPRFGRIFSCDERTSERSQG